MAVYVFSDESGTFKAHPCFVIGLVITSAHEALEQRIEELRQERRYQGREFKYEKTDKLKIPFCKALIDLFMSDKSMEFRCIVKSRQDHDLGYYKKVKGPTQNMSPADLAYNYTYNQVLRNNLKDWFVLIMDRRDLSKRNNLYSYLMSEVFYLQDVQPHDSRAFNLLQLADLLTGCVYGDCTDVQNRVKREIIDYLKRALGVRKLSVRTPWRLKSKFNVWHWSPPAK